MTTTISSISRAAPVGVDYDADMSNMTPADVLFYCQTRLNKLQEDISKQAEKQRKTNKAAEILADLTRELGEMGEGQVPAVEVQRMRDAYEQAAGLIGDLGGDDMAKLAARVRGAIGGFDAGFTRTVHFSDGTTYRMNAGESDNIAQDRHDGWVRWNAAGQPRLEKGDPLTHDMTLASEWEGDVISGRDGVEEGAGKVPQAGATIARVTFTDNNVASNTMQHFREDIKDTQGLLNENSQTGLDELRDLMQKREQALQITQTMMQALQEQMRAAEQWR